MAVPANLCTTGGDSDPVSSPNRLTSSDLSHLLISPESANISFEPAPNNRHCELPVEIWLHIFSFITEPRNLLSVSQVSKAWMDLAEDEALWQNLCNQCQFNAEVHKRNRMAIPTSARPSESEGEPLAEMEEFASVPMDPALEWLYKRRNAQSLRAYSDPAHSFSYRTFFKRSYQTLHNWRGGGRLLRAHPIPATSAESGVNCVALDSEWVIVGLSNGKLGVFSAYTGVLSRMLLGHEGGVWCLQLIGRRGLNLRRKGDEEGIDTELTKPIFPGALKEAIGLDPKPPEIVALMDDSPQGDDSESPSNHTTRLLGKPSEPSGLSHGWGQPNSLIVSGGLDKTLKVWDVQSGSCIYALNGHTGTIRCLKTLHFRPIAVSGSRDGTLRVWNIQWGVELRVLNGHQGSVRCLDVCGSRVVSGSYDSSCRIWDIDSGQCLHVLQGHHRKVFCIAFDGVRIASSGEDADIRIWDPDTGVCLASLHTHTTPIFQLQLSSPHLAVFDGELWRDTKDTPPSSARACYEPLVLSASVDGFVAAHSLETFQERYRIAAHRSVVTSLQFDEHFIVTGGRDGLVRVFETGTGKLVRDWYTTPALNSQHMPIVHPRLRGNSPSPGRAAIISSTHSAPPISPFSDEGAYSRPAETVWRVAFGGCLSAPVGDGPSASSPGHDLACEHDMRGKDVCLITSRRKGRTVVEIWRMAPKLSDRAMHMQEQV
ncbi:hypothetical protein HGRIS_005254 [Hohenbuehelia grisea]|uniref:F-box domain-containing protein n=1 Tax=Hohenbuehelia grisea TaxID=104357 RepID=A0ABR3JEF5_9AGAR